MKRFFLFQLEPSLGNMTTEELLSYIRENPIEYFSFGSRKLVGETIHDVLKQASHESLAYQYVNRHYNWCIEFERCTYSWFAGYTYTRLLRVDMLVPIKWNLNKDNKKRVDYLINE